MDQTERLESDLEHLYYDLSDATGAGAWKLQRKIDSIELKLQELDLTF